MKTLYKIDLFGLPLRNSDSRPCEPAVQRFQTLFPKGMEIDADQIQRYLRPPHTVSARTKREWVSWFLSFAPPEGVIDELAEYLHCPGSEDAYTLRCRIYYSFGTLSKARLIAAAVQVLERM